MKKQIITLGVAVVAFAVALVLHSRNEAGRPQTLRWPTMGTVAQISVRGRLADLDALAERVRGVYKETEDYLSAWNPASELCRLSAAGCTNWEEAASRPVRPCYAAALRLARESQGAFNPEIGRTLRALGVGRGTYSTFDLGAIAKGFAVDAAARAIAPAAAGASLLVDLGGNLRVVGERPWRTGIRNPFAAVDPARPPYCAIIALTNGESVATSGTYERFIEKDGRRFSHILDGRTGKPVGGLAGVTVVTPADYGAILADGLSTTLFVLGPEAGRTFLATYYPRALALWIPDTPAAPRLIATKEMARRLEKPFAPLETRYLMSSSPSSPSTSGAMKASISDSATGESAFHAPSVR